MSIQSKAVGYGGVTVLSLLLSGCFHNRTRRTGGIAQAKTYMTVDLTTGSVSYSGSISDLTTNDAYKTTMLVLKRIEAGTFKMGDEVRLTPLELVHTVNITKDFYIGVFEVTQRQWSMIKGSWPSHFVSDPTSLNEERPVEQVSWDDIKIPGGFMDKLSLLTSLSCRLPTEAEWEYCCKAGTATDHYYGNMLDGSWMWGNFNSGSQTHEVATTTKKPNPWGLYDMHGNVLEWCEDRYSSGYYSISPADDPGGPDGGGVLGVGERVLRGGSWGTGHWESWYRSHIYKWKRSNLFGFRVVVSIAGA